MSPQGNGRYDPRTIGRKYPGCSRAFGLGSKSANRAYGQRRRARQAGANCVGSLRFSPTLGSYGNDYLNRSFYGLDDMRDRTLPIQARMNADCVRRHAFFIVRIRGDLH